MKLFPLSAALVLAVAACNKPADTATAPNVAPPEPAAPASVATAPQAPEAPAHFELTMDKVDKLFAAQVQLAAAQEADPSVDPAMNASEEDTGRYAERLASTPALRAAIERAGLSTRDYALTMDALLGALMAVGAVESGALKEIPDGIDPQHVAFVKQHRAQIEAKMQGANAQR